MGKTVLLGLDGATFEILDPMLDTGRLPVLAGLLRGGIRSTLESTLPPFTCPAWPTMFTGRNPGAHGALMFRVIAPGTRTARSVSLRDVACPRLWEVLNRAGIRTGVFNVPGTYPAERVDGFMVSGFVCPPGAPEMIQPVGLRNAFMQAFPAYDPNGSSGHDRKHLRRLRWQRLERLEAILRMRLAALEWLLAREPVDFLWVVLMTLDRVSHMCYGLLSPASDLYATAEAAETRERVLDLLEVLDRTIGRILEAMGPDPLVMVVSDHGFSWKPKQFDLWSWLVAHGFLVPKRGARVRSRLWAAFRSAFRRVFGPTAWEWTVRVGLRVLRRRDPSIKEIGRCWTPHKEQVGDPSRSKVWLGPQIEFGVRINVRAGDVPAAVSPEDCAAVAESLVERLRQARDPATGQPIMARVARREEVYDGPYVGRAPEVVFVPQRDIAHQTKPLHGANQSNGWLVPAPQPTINGTHDSFGVFAGLGKPFGRGTVRGIRILDVMPTLLYAMGLPVPDDLEGRVVEEAFREPHRVAHPIETCQGLGSAALSAPAPYSAEDEEAIGRRLEELGYL